MFWIFAYRGFDLESSILNSSQLKNVFNTSIWAVKIITDLFKSKNNKPSKLSFIETFINNDQSRQKIVLEHFNDFLKAFKCLKNDFRFLFSESAESLETCNQWGIHVCSRLLILIKFNIRCSKEDLQGHQYFCSKNDYTEMH